MKRNKLSKSGSRRLFQSTANRKHKLNFAYPMRGGLRL
jgi:hypothetical protein